MELWEKVNNVRTRMPKVVVLSGDGKINKIRH